MASNSLRRSLIAESELIDIFQQQYDDIFSEMLKIDQFTFFSTLKKQVMIYLEITNNKSSNILLKKVEEIFVKKYLEEKEIVYKYYEEIKYLSDDQIDYLDRLNCIIHCTKCKDALHTCGQRFILYGDYVFCLFCMKVYNENQVNMYCEECDIEYYTKLREIIDYDLESYFVASISDYHCRLDYEEKVKCPQCERDLFIDINSLGNIDKVEDVICLNCNLIFDANLFNYKCKQCGKNFKSDLKIYNCFYEKRNDLICKVHTLIDKKFASPECTTNKGCDCNLNYIMKYKHSDGGTLYEGERNGQKIILCDKCFQIFDYYHFNFTCPLCKRTFNPLFVDTFQQINPGYESSNVPSREYNKFKYDRGINTKNSLYLQKNRTVKKMPIFHKEQNQNKSTTISNEKRQKGQFSSSYKNNAKTKNNYEENPFNTKTKLLKTNYNKINLKTTSKTARDNEKGMIKNKIYNYPYKNQNQGINIKIQNFYNNYAPIIHIVGKNPKNIENNRNSKYILRRNYAIIDTSPRRNRKNKTIINNTKSISNAVFLKRSITENSKYNLGLENPNKVKRMNEDIEKEPNINFHNNKSNNKKLYSASFTNVSPNQNMNKFFDCGVNYQNQKNRNSVENDKIKYKLNNNKNKSKKKDYDKINISDIINNKRKKMAKVNTIKEIKEEYINDLNEIQSLRPKKVIKLANNIDNSLNERIINRKNTGITALSLSEEKNKKKPEKNKKKNLEDNIDNKQIIKLKSKRNNYTNTNPNNINKKGNSKLDSSEQKINIINIKKEKKVQKNIKNQKASKTEIIKDFKSEDYNILNIIGEGTFSQIFLVQNNKNLKKYALKKMAATKMEELEEKKEEFELIMKLTTEEEKLNLIKIYGIQIKQLDKFNIVLYVLMEAAISDWETELKNRHYDKRFYSEEELKKILTNLVETFSSLQRKGICHRDVKPQNILSFGNGIYKITDFGEAKSNKSNCKNFNHDTSVQTVRGTELYMSPILFNALRNSPGDDLQYNAFKSDVFSLGLCFLLACSLSYKPLFEMRDANNMDNVKILIDKHLNKRYSKNIYNILLTMLQLEEKERPDFIELELIIKTTYK